MKVKELIEYLSKCNPEYNVLNFCEDDVNEVVERTNFSNPADSYVQLY